MHNEVMLRCTTDVPVVRTGSYYFSTKRANLRQFQVSNHSLHEYQASEIVLSCQSHAELSHVAYRYHNVPYYSKRRDIKPRESGRSADMYVARYIGKADTVE